jgi:hypothetical protein
LIYLTDERLKGYLDTNQQHREQMCLAVLALDKRFSNVRPRHPRGGPDGGRDIDAVFGDRQIAFGAVSFVNQANDSDEQKKAIRRKFRGDVSTALGAHPTPEVFVFFTNLNLTVTEKNELIARAKTAGFAYCEIFDRERLRVSLDSVDGFSIRFQYLGLPLSEAEQASFFAKWGDNIQALVSMGFQRLEQTLARLQFLVEAPRALSTLMVLLELDRVYSADEIGHFRAYCLLFFPGPRHGVWSILFGSSDKQNRMRALHGEDLASAPAGIKHGLSGAAWERHWHFSGEDEAEIENDSENASDEKEELQYRLVGSSTWVGIDPVETIAIAYDHDDVFPRLSLGDIDAAMFIFYLNEALANKIKCIRAYANEYKLQEISSSEFTIDVTPVNPNIPVKFTDAEISDQWVRIRPKIASVFLMSFSTQTPKRMFDSLGTPSSSDG